MYENVGAREPCPCGSGRRFKACHGKEAAKAAVAFVSRPFDGLDHEAAFVAMREILPSATMTATLTTGGAVTFVTILPDQVAAMRTPSGRLLIAMQTPTGTGDASRDLASAIQAAQSLANDEDLAVAPMGGSARLQDLLASVDALQLHDTFGFWELDAEEIEHASHGIVPTTPVDTDVYWCAFPDRTVVRWVIADDEDRVLDALARLSAAGRLRIGEDSKYLGAFRADGIMIPVWEVHADAGALAGPMRELQATFSQARALTTPLSDGERRARSGVIGRNLTLR
jgi:hypothetical protein